MMTATQLSQQCHELTHEYVVTDKVYEAFKACSGDTNALHVDETYACDKGFKARVMYGNILNAFLSHFVGMLLPTDRVMIHAQDIAYHAPFYLGDTLRLHATCDTVSEAAGVVIYKFKFTRDDDDKCRLIARGHIQIGILE